MKKIKRFITIVIISFSLYIGIKSFIISPISIDNYVVCEKVDNMGQINRIILTPKNEMLYIKKYEETVETALYKISGREAQHYFFGVYSIGDFPLGFRIYNNAEEILISNLILKKKVGESFPNIGEKFQTVFIVYKDKVKVNNELYNRIKINDEDKRVIKNGIEKFDEIDNLN